ncbi:MAG: hypothetical protein NTW74_12885 [Acidobacteria bacterium]|nr:hypothetical protein [Acidobacteriota bacterium]
MQDQSLSATELAQSLKAGLTDIRQLLLHAPSSLSLESTGPALEDIAGDLLALSTALTPASPESLREIQLLSNSVQALYRQASSFYSGLAAESIKNGTWDAASYSPEGDWSQPASSSSSRVLAEG